MSVFHTIAMFCAIDALSLNNTSKNATTFKLCTRVVGNLSSSTFELLCAISTTIFSQLSAESRNTSLLIAPKRTAYENRIPCSILARPEAFSHSKIPTHLFPRVTPPLISTDEPTLPPNFPHRPSPTDLSFTNTSSTDISFANPSPTKLKFPTPTTLCESSITLSASATGGIIASPKQCLSSSNASLQDPCSNLKPVRNCLFSFLQLGIPRC